MNDACFIVRDANGQAPTSISRRSRDGARLPKLLTAARSVSCHHLKRA
jgi:hypothetical protein